MKEENKNTCSCGCQEEHTEAQCNCGCEESKHEESCSCGCNEEEKLDPIMVDLEDENGNKVTCEVVEEFEYKEDIYALVENPENKAVYLFKEEIEGDEVQLVNPEDGEFEEVTKYYENLNK